MKNTNRKHMKFDIRFWPIVPTSLTIEWLHAFLLFKVRVKYYDLAYKITLETPARATIPFISKLYVIPNNNLINCNLLVFLPSSLSGFFLEEDDVLLNKQGKQVMME